MTVYRVLLVILIGWFAVETLAQGRPTDDVVDTPLAACTVEDVQAALYQLDESNVVNDLEATLINISEDVNNFVLGYGDLVHIRNTYYLDIEPTLPDCHAVWRFELAFSAYLTNVTLNTGNLIIGILVGDIEPLTALTKPMNATMQVLRLRADSAHATLYLLAGETAEIGR